jgi:nucleotide-binding universal stress UspA family protein
MGLFHTILVPIDGSEASDAACALAVRLAAEQSASIAFVNVVETDKIIASVVPGQGYADPMPAIDALRTGGGEMLKDALAVAKAAGVAATSELAEGDCLSTILDQAKSRSADLIVMGSHGRGGVARLMLGSIAEGVLRNGATPVLVTKAHKD